jgi:hypothetical protein
MYQTIIENRKDGAKAFEELYRVFLGAVLRGLDIPSDSSEWDMKAKYTPNWACAWNSPMRVGMPCVILEKNDKIAIVSFEGEMQEGENKMNLPKNIYRLEDLEHYKQ